MECGQPLPICLPRAQGFDMGLVAVLEKPEHVATYAVHPAHLEYVTRSEFTRLRTVCNATIVG
jgi:hypothetical protein